MRSTAPGRVAEQAIELALGKTVALARALPQAAAAFVAVQGAFNWLIDNFPRLAECLSSANRVGNLLIAFDRLETEEGSAESALAEERQTA